MIARLEYYVLLVVTALSRGEWPLELPIYGGMDEEMMTWRNNNSSYRKCLLFLQVLGKAHALLRTNTYSTKRYLLPFVILFVPS